MSDAGRDLLDGAQWAVESVALLPETDLDALSVVTFMLSPDLQEQADALAGGSEQMAAFLAEAVDLEVEIGSAWVFDPEAWHGAVKEIGLAYSDLSGLSTYDVDFLEVLAELRVPLFESQSKTSETIEKWGGRAGTVIGAVGTVGGLGVGGHVGAVIALVAPPLGVAIIIGTYGAVGGIALAGYLKRRREGRNG